MPSIEFKCRQCEHTFVRVTLNRDASGPQICPECKSADVKPSVQPISLFNGITSFSSLAKDTN